MAKTDTEFNTEAWLESSEYLSVLQALHTHAIKRSNFTALMMLENDRQVVWSFEKLWRGICAAAERLRESGAKRTERVALIGENSLEWLLYYFGTLQAGCTVVPLDPQFGASTVERIVHETEPCVTISNRPVTHTESSEYIELGTDPEKFAAEGKLDEPPDRKGMAQAIIYTSGTTGKPKGVVLTDANIRSNVRDIMSLGLTMPGGVITSFLPYFHAYSLTASVIMPLFAGMAICMSSLDPSAIRKSMAEFSPTHMIAVPRLLRLIVQGIKRRLSEGGPFNSLMLGIYERAVQRLKNGRSNIYRPLLGPLRGAFGSRMKYVVSGGARLEPEIFYGIRALGFKVLEGYGLTETSPILCLNPPDKAKAGSVGLPLPSVQLRLAEEKEGLGEITVKGPNVFEGYFNSEQETQEVFENGWFSTGDLGRIDDDGFVFIEGRAKELIVTESGKNIFPAEVEKVFDECEHVRETCLVQHAEEGSSPKLKLVVVPDIELMRKENIHNIDQQIRFEITETSKELPSYQRPAQLEKISSPLPRTRLGKIKRHEVEKLLNDSDDTEDERHEPMGKVQELIAAYTERKYVAPDAHLEVDLGLDSLARMDLHAYLEQNLGVSVNEEDASDAQTVREVAEVFEESSPQSGETRELQVPKLTVIKRMAQAVGDLAVRLFLKARMNVKFEALDLPQDGPYIIAPNHTSFLDALVLRCFLPVKVRRRLVFLSVGKYFDRPLLRVVAWAFRIVVIGRDKNPTQAFATLAKALEEGDIAVVFPEGVRTPDGSIQKPRLGTFRLAGDSGVKVYPVAMKGLYGFYSRGGERHSDPVTASPTEPLDGADADPRELADKWFEAMEKHTNG